MGVWVGGPVVWGKQQPWCFQERRYAGLKPGELPACESLKDTIARALPFWNEEIVPQIKAGKRVLIAAHGNSLRGIVKHLEGKAWPSQGWQSFALESVTNFSVSNGSAFSVEVGGPQAAM